MAEAAILAVAGWFLAPTIKELMDWARTKLGDKYKFHKDFVSNREKVARALHSMRSNVEDMKKYSITDSHIWCDLWELLDEIQDSAEEFMDKFQQEVIEANREGTKTKFDGSAEKLKQLLDLLEERKKSSRDLLKRIQTKQQHNPRPLPDTTTSGKRAKELFGYKQELEDLVSELTTVSAGGTRVVGIIGHGGIGKTELAQWAFNHPKVEGHYRFGLRIWVSVSGMFNQDALLEKIFKATFQNNYYSRGQISGTTPAFHEKRLKEEINRAGSYLLVLDDVCNDETSDEAQRKATWERVLAPFKQQKGANRSLILLTSRTQICLDTLGTCVDARAPQRKKILLNGINDTAQLKLLLMEEARRQTGETVVEQELKKHLEKNVGKLHGSPLAARKFVSISTQSARFSDSGNRSFLKNITEEGRIEDVLVKDHLSSFEVLPSHLQRCFAFCSIFPKGWRFEVEKLTRMWTALGFVEAPYRQGGRTVDHVAKEYFDALVERSLFQQVAGTSCYEIHEHIHSMIRKVCPTYYHRIDRRSRGIVPPSTVGHLSVTTDCLDQLQAAAVYGLRRLRTLLVFDKDDEQGEAAATATSSPTSASSISTDDIMNRLIPQKKKDLKNKLEGVRVLDLSNTARISAVPVGIGNLEHLRYLGLASTIGCLSDDVTKLLPLQTLSVIFKGDDCRLPKDMNRLINLLHLDLGKPEYMAQIAGIGSMRMLQDSVEFHVRRRQQGHSMSELGGLNSLRGTLTIKCLENVRSSDQAKSARLGAKVHLRTLELEWGTRRSNSAAAGRSAQNSDLVVLEGLRPHPYLEDLKIQNYVGTRSPHWLEQENAADSAKSAVMLRNLYLLNCRNLNRLPLVGWLPNLVRMEVQHLDSVKKIDATFCGAKKDAFPSLRWLWLSDMAELDAWEGTGDEDDGSGSGSAPVLFPNLREVKIVRCPKLRSLHGLLCCRRSLRHLHVEKCPAVNTEFERSEFHPDLQLNNREWPPRLRFKGPPRRRQPPTTPQQQQGGRPPPHPSNDVVDIPPWVYLLVICAVIWWYLNKGRRPAPRQRQQSNGVNIPPWVLLVIVVVMLCYSTR